MPGGDVDEALAQIRSSTILTDSEYKAICDSVANRLVARSTPPDCGAQGQSERAEISAWVSQTELARLLKVPAVTVRVWRSRGKLPTSETVGGRPVWSRRVVREFAGALTALAK